MKLTRAAVAAGVLASALALAACGSSSSSSGSSDSKTNSSSSGSSSASAGTISCTGAGALSADGSTAQQVAIAAWTKAYDAKCGVTVGYSGGGSGQGVTDFTNKKVNFAGSDSALDPTKGEVKAATTACGSQAIDLPMVTGPIAIAFNLKGVTDLTLKPDTIAKIFTGKIKTWNDPEIKAENSSASLPSTAISVFFRSDQSGTTNNFEKYLAAVSPSIYTATPSKTWVGAGKGQNGSSGVQAGIKSTDGGVGYIEAAYSNGAGLSTAKVDTGSGGVPLTVDSVGKAVASAKVVPSGAGDLSLKLDYSTTAAGAYPILLVTYEIVCSKYSSPTIGAAVKSFLTYTSSSAGQSILTGVGSAPLPESVLTQVQAAVAKIS